MAIGLKGLIALTLLHAAWRPADPPPRVITLTRPDASLSEEFAYITGLRVLTDGRVLVSDRLDERVVVADFARDRVSAVGRRGPGPAEYYLPGRFFPWPGDSTLLVDEGNTRLVIIGPDLAIRRSMSIQRDGNPMALWPGSVDGRGRVYVVVPGWVLRIANPDSLPLIRWDPSTDRIDTVARVVPRAPRPPGPRLRPGLPYIPFSPADAWTVTSSGELIVVRARDYRLERLSPDGHHLVGPALPWSPVTVTLEDKRAAARHFLEIASSGNRGNGDRPPGALSAIPAEQRTERAVNDLVADNAFAETKPPFTDAGVLASPDGTIWVERSLRHGEPSAWDGIGTDGHLIARIVLPAGRRLAALSDNAAYLVSRDADGIERLERYRLR